MKISFTASAQAHPPGAPRLASSARPARLLKRGIRDRINASAGTGTSAVGKLIKRLETSTSSQQSSHARISRNDDQGTVDAPVSAVMLIASSVKVNCASGVFIRFKAPSVCRKDKTQKITT